MNAGKDKKKAHAQAQANANLDGRSRWVHLWNGVYWISNTPISDAFGVNAEEVKPCKTPAK